MSKTHNAGIVTAYGAAVRGGYTGTYEEFCAQQAQYAENARQMEQAVSDVRDIKTSVESAVSIAETHANNAGQSATNASNSATQASGFASNANQSAESASQSADNASNSANNASQSASSAQTSANNASASERNAKQSAEDAQDILESVQTEGDTQVSRVQAKGQEVLDSLPEDFTQVQKEISEINGSLEQTKADLNNYNSVDVLTSLARTSSSRDGVTFTYNANGSCTVTGTATASTFNNFFSETSRMPFGVVPGKTYHVQYMAEKVRFRIYPYVNGALGASICDTTSDTVITIPSDATGLIIRLFVARGITVSETVNPLLFNALSNEELTDSVVLSRKYTLKMAMFGDSILYGRDGDSQSALAIEKNIPYYINRLTYLSVDNFSVGSIGWVTPVNNQIAYDVISNVDLSEYDMVLMCYGVNDSSGVIGDWNSTDDTTILGQINKCIQYIGQEYPDVRIILVPPFNTRSGTFPNYGYDVFRNGWTRQELSDKIKRVSDYYHLQFISQEDSPLNAYGMDVFCGSDNVHPNEEGYRVLGHWFANKIMAYTNDSEGEKQYLSLKSDIVDVADDVTDLQQYNAYNLLHNLQVNDYSAAGITFSNNPDGTLTVVGTATAATFINLYYNTSSLLRGIEPGKTYWLKYNSAKVGFRMLGFVNGNFNMFLESLKDTVVVIPSTITGLVIRLQVSNGATVNETIEMPKLLPAPSNGDLLNGALNDNCVNLSSIMLGKTTTTNGIQFRFNENGTISVTGTATGPAFNNLYFNDSVLPAGLEVNKTYRIKYSSNKVFLRIYAYINGSTIKICDTLQDTRITIPEGTAGLIIRLQVLTGITVSETFAFPVILTAFSNRELTDIVQGYASEPMLTIIDDDGDVHFKYDLLPLIAELNVPIASAVTPTRIAASEAAEPGTYYTRWMTWAQIQDCAKGGAEITCHMYSHPTPEQIEAMTLDEIAHRLYMAKNNMKIHGVDSNALVYSFGTGATGQKLHQAAERVFDCGFSNTSNATPIHSDYDRYDLPRYVIDGDNNYNVENMKNIIDNIATNGGWAVWMIHTSSGPQWRNILDGEGNDTGVADTDGTGNYVGKLRSVPALREAIQYALSMGVKIVTAEYGLKKYFVETGRMS